MNETNNQRRCPTKRIWLCLSACLSACAVEGPAEETAAAASEQRVLIDVRATDGLERIHQAAGALATSCHGTTTCPGGIVIGGFFTIECGAQFCSTQGCGKCLPLGDPDCTLKSLLRQPREQYQPFVMPDGTVCLAYHPTTPLDVSCSCFP